MKKLFLISAAFLLIVSIAFFLTSLDSIKEWRIRSTKSEMVMLEENRNEAMSKLQESMSMTSAARLATRVYNIDDELRIYETHLKYLQNLNTAYRFRMSVVCWMGSFFLFLFSFISMITKKDKKFIVNTDDVDNIIADLSRQEGRVKLLRWYLGASFFLFSLAFFILYYLNVRDKNAEFLVIQYCVYALLIIAGYFWHKFLGEKQEKIWEEKVEYLDFREIFK